MNGLYLLKLPAHECRQYSDNTFFCSYILPCFIVNPIDTTMGRLLNEMSYVSSLSRLAQIDIRMEQNMEEERTGREGKEREGEEGNLNEMRGVKVDIMYSKRS